MPNDTAASAPCQSKFMSATNIENAQKRYDRKSRSLLFWNSVNIN